MEDELMSQLRELTAEVKKHGKKWSLRQNQLRCADGRCPLGLLAYEKAVADGLRLNESQSYAFRPDGSLMDVRCPDAHSAANFLGISVDLAKRMIYSADDVYGYQGSRNLVRELLNEQG